MSGASFPPLSSSSSGSMSASRRQCSLYSNIVSKDPMVNKVSDRLALASDLMEIEKKSVVAVVENLLDSKEDNQELQDKYFLENFCSINDLPTPVRIHRVPCKFENVLARPTKVHFSSRADRDTFLRSFSSKWRTHPNRPIGPRPVRARRDMTREELNVLRTVRKEAYEANAKLGIVKYVVQDLKIVELQSPTSYPKSC
uniref:Uncharacterized protein n=1 Tax=Caenorhabditis japonica TaxID=281687 RepID=A0A8R1EJU4_CAEJA